MSKSNSIALASPLGGCGFAMTCFVTGFTFTGIYPVEEGIAMVLPMMLLFAGISQYIVGILEFCRGNHALGFCHGAYGIWGTGTAVLFYTIFAGLVPEPTAVAMAIYWAGWAIITCILTASCWPVSKCFATVLAWLAVCFILFSIGAFYPLITQVGGWATIIDGFGAWYCVAAFSINTSFGKNILPIS